MVRTQNSFITRLPMFLITIVVSLIRCSGAYAQDETDPQRWGRVKTWTGTFTYSCNDSDTFTLEGITTELIWNDSISGSFTLTTRNSPQPNRYIWNGTGVCGGTINEETIQTDQDGSCTYTWEKSQPPPLVPVPGYSLAINALNGTYFFQAETIQWPNVEATTCCDGDCSTGSVVYGNGGITSSFQTLPASGFSLKGSYNGVLQIGMSQLTATITWDIRATEVSPPPSSCPIKNSTHNQNHLRLLYALRKGLAGSEAGRMVTSLYYEHAPEVSSILLRTPDLRDRLRKIVAIYAASAETAGTNEPVAVSDELIEQTECFLDELTREASVPLLQAIELARDTIHDRLLLTELGLAVH